ncbi:MAG TPA: hypothetical protein VER14_08340 [Phototrophicaceae bacterium]|nr:hypothetical protein [Phototrophicaceae bacterium]
MHRQLDRDTIEHSQSLLKTPRGIILVAAVVGVILIVDYLLRGGTTPNNRTLAQYLDPCPPTSRAIRFASCGLNHHCSGAGRHRCNKSSFVSVEGKYVFSDLPPGNYIIMATFPDGSSTS